MKQKVAVELEQRQHSHAVHQPDLLTDLTQNFVDNRRETTAQRYLMTGINASPRMAAQRKVTELMRNSPQMLALRQQDALMQSKTLQLTAQPDEEMMQGKFKAQPKITQRMENEALLQAEFKTIQKIDEDELLQGKLVSEQPVQLEQQLATKPNNTGLPDKLKLGIESLSGIAMDNVKVHYNSSKPTQLNAHAYAQGTDIHVAPGQEQYLSHEAWHVVQQARGQVKPTMQMKNGISVNDDAELEREADLMGEKAVSAGVTPKKRGSDDSTESDYIGYGFEGNQPESIAQRKLQQLIQMNWSDKEEMQAQKKLMPIHNKEFNVPTWNVLDQQAWAGLGNKGAMVQWGKRKYRDVLQPIDADKVVARAAQILEKKVTVEPPPVAFSTDTAIDANPMNGELILLDSHHTVNAARILHGDDTISVRHNAKPNYLGDIAKSRKAITKNKNIAKKYNQRDLGWAAYEEAYKEILKLKQNKKGNAPMKHRREKGG